MSQAENDLTWDAFLAQMAEHYSSQAGDRLVWRVTKPGREMACYLREIHTAHGIVALELRGLHNGQVYLTEAHKERVAFHRRVDELRRMLKAEGWIAEQQP